MSCEVVSSWNDDIVRDFDFDGVSKPETAFYNPWFMRGGLWYNVRRSFGEGVRLRKCAAASAE